MSPILPDDGNSNPTPRRFSVQVAYRVHPRRLANPCGIFGVRFRGDRSQKRQRANALCLFCGADDGNSNPTPRCFSVQVAFLVHPRRLANPCGICGVRFRGDRSQKRQRADALCLFCGADDGNRTHTASLGSWSSTTKLHPRTKVVYHALLGKARGIGRFFRFFSGRCPATLLRLRRNCATMNKNRAMPPFPEGVCLPCCLHPILCLTACSRPSAM